MSRRQFGRLDLSGAIGRYGVSYVRKVCAHAHVPFGENSADEDIFALDGDIKYLEGSIRVQIKGTTQWSLKNGRESLYFPIEDEWREKWRRQINPAYLVVVLLARDELDWVRYEEQFTVLNSYALWSRIDGIDEGTTSVELKRTRRFTAETIDDWHSTLISEYGVGV